MSQANETRERVSDLIEEYGRLEIYDVDGGVCDLSFGSPVDGEVRETIRKQLDGPVPDELAAYAEAGSRTRGIWMEGVGLNASPAQVRRGLGGAVRGIRNCLPFGSDGFGNGLYLQVRPSGCRAWYLPHDPAAIVLMGHSLLDFLERRLTAIRAYKEVTDQWVAAAEADDFDRELPPEPSAPEDDFRRLEPVAPEEVPPVDSEAFNHVCDRHDGPVQVVDLRDGDLPAGVDLTRPDCRTLQWRQFGELLVGLGASREEPASSSQAEPGRGEPSEDDPWWKFW